MDTSPLFPPLPISTQPLLPLESDSLEPMQGDLAPALALNPAPAPAVDKRAFYPLLHPTDRLLCSLIELGICDEEGFLKASISLPALAGDEKKKLDQLLSLPVRLKAYDPDSEELVKSEWIKTGLGPILTDLLNIVLNVGQEAIASLQVVGSTPHYLLGEKYYHDFFSSLFENLPNSLTDPANELLKQQLQKQIDEALNSFLKNLSAATGPLNLSQAGDLDLRVTIFAQGDEFLHRFDAIASFLEQQCAGYIEEGRDLRLKKAQQMGSFDQFLLFTLEYDIPDKPHHFYRTHADFVVIKKAQRKSLFFQDNLMLDITAESIFLTYDSQASSRPFSPAQPLLDRACKLINWDWDQGDFNIQAFPLLMNLISKGYTVWRENLVKPLFQQFLKQARLSDKGCIEAIASVLIQTTQKHLAAPQKAIVKLANALFYLHQFGQQEGLIAEDIEAIRKKLCAWFANRYPVADEEKVTRALFLALNNPALSLNLIFSYIYLVAFIACNQQNATVAIFRRHDGQGAIQLKVSGDETAPTLLLPCAQFASDAPFSFALLAKNLPALENSAEAEQFLTSFYAHCLPKCPLKGKNSSPLLPYQLHLNWDREQLQQGAALLLNAPSIKSKHLGALLLLTAQSLFAIALPEQLIEQIPHALLYDSEAFPPSRLLTSLENGLENGLEKELSTLPSLKSSLMLQEHRSLNQLKEAWLLTLAQAGTAQLATFALTAWEKLEPLRQEKLAKKMLPLLLANPLVAYQLLTKAKDILAWQLQLQYLAKLSLCPQFCERQAALAKIAAILACQSRSQPLELSLATLQEISRLFKEPSLASLLQEEILATSLPPLKQLAITAKIWVAAKKEETASFKIISLKSLLQQFAPLEEQKKAALLAQEMVQQKASWPLSLKLAKLFPQCLQNPQDLKNHLFLKTIVRPLKQDASNQRHFLNQLFALYKQSENKGNGQHLQQLALYLIAAFNWQMLDNSEALFALFEPPLSQENADAVKMTKKMLKMVSAKMVEQFLAKKNSHRFLQKLPQKLPLLLKWLKKYPVEPTWWQPLLLACASHRQLTDNLLAALLPKSQILQAKGWEKELPFWRHLAFQLDELPELFLVHCLKGKGEFLHAFLNSLPHHLQEKASLSFKLSQALTAYIETIKNPAQKAASAAKLLALRAELIAAYNVKKTKEEASFELSLITACLPYTQGEELLLAFAPLFSLLKSLDREAPPALAAAIETLIKAMRQSANKLAAHAKDALEQRWRQAVVLFQQKLPLSQQPIHLCVSLIDFPWADIESYAHWWSEKFMAAFRKKLPKEWRNLGSTQAYICLQILLKAQNKERQQTAFCHLLELARSINKNKSVVGFMQKEIVALYKGAQQQMLLTLEQENSLSAFVAQFNPLFKSLTATACELNQKGLIGGVQNWVDYGKKLWTLFSNFSKKTTVKSTEEMVLFNRSFFEIVKTIPHHFLWQWINQELDHFSLKKPSGREVEFISGVMGCFLKNLAHIDPQFSSKNKAAEMRALMVQASLKFSSWVALFPEETLLACLSRQNFKQLNEYYQLDRTDWLSSSRFRFIQGEVPLAPQKKALNLEATNLAISDLFHLTEGCEETMGNALTLSFSIAMSFYRFWHKNKEALALNKQQLLSPLKLHLDFIEEQIQCAFAASKFNLYPLKKRAQTFGSLFDMAREQISPFLFISPAFLPPSSLKALTSHFFQAQLAFLQKLPASEMQPLQVVTKGLLKTLFLAIKHGGIRQEKGEPYLQLIFAAISAKNRSELIPYFKGKKDSFQRKLAQLQMASLNLN